MCESSGRAGAANRHRAGATGSFRWRHALCSGSSLRTGEAMQRESNRPTRPWTAMLLSLAGALVGVAIVVVGCGSSSNASYGGQDSGQDGGQDTSVSAEGASTDATACPSGQKMCGSSCTNTTFDPSNCGACGVACAGGQVCAQSACKAECATGQSACTVDGGIVSTSTNSDGHNCGTCRNV